MRADTSQLKQRSDQRMVDLSSSLLPSERIDKHQQSEWAQRTWKIDLRIVKVTESQQTMTYFGDAECSSLLWVFRAVLRYFVHWSLRTRLGQVNWIRPSLHSNP